MRNLKPILLILIFSSISCLENLQNKDIETVKGAHSDLGLGETYLIGDLARVYELSKNGCIIY